MREIPTNLQKSFELYLITILSELSIFCTAAAYVLRFIHASILYYILYQPKVSKPDAAKAGEPERDCNDDQRIGGH